MNVAEHFLKNQDIQFELLKKLCVCVGVGWGGGRAHRVHVKARLVGINSLVPPLGFQ